MLQISVIIPAHNEERYIVKTLQSVHQQDFSDYEILVIANACTDKTIEIAAKYAKVYATKRKGVSLAKNIGAAKAKGEILVFLDADTNLAKNCLSEINKKFTSEYSVGTVKVKPDNFQWRYRILMGLKNCYFRFGFYEGSNGIVFCRKKDAPPHREDLQLREQRYFIKELLKKGKYCFVSSSTVTTSMRRYEKSIFGTLYFWAKKFIKDWMGNIGGDEYPPVR